MTNHSSEILSRLDTARSLMADIAELPTVPAVVIRIAGKLNSPDTPVVEITDLLLQDQVLSARVLRLVNSPYYSPSTHLSSLRDAVIYLGMDTLREAVLTCAIVDLFKNRSSTFDRSVIWSHTLAVAKVAKLLCERTGCADPGNAYLAGLLHDIGEVFLNFYRSPDFKKVAELSEAENFTFIDSENALLGTSHSEIGYLLGSRWQLNDFILESILHHHEPLAASPENAVIVAVITISDLFCTMNAIGFEGLGESNLSRRELEKHYAWEVIGDAPGVGVLDPRKLLEELTGKIDRIRSEADTLFHI